MKIYSMEVQIVSLETNCYLLCDEEAKVCAVVDPGGEPERISAVIAQSGCALQAIYLTHGHYDHTGAVAALCQAHPDLPVYLHKADFPGPTKSGFPLKDQLAEAGLLDRIKFYDEGDRLTLGSLTIQVLHTPGHTPGSVCLVTDGVLFSGDTLFAGSMGRTDFPGGSYPDMVKSLRRLAALPDDLALLPGHMGTSTLGREKRINPYLQMATGQP